MQIENEKLIDMYRVMVRIRTFEERVKKEFAAGNIPGFVHLYSGQEAIAAGACATLKPDDYMAARLRGHGQIIAKGAKTDLMMAELYGKRTGYCKGKGGSMHLADLDLGILGANGILGSGILIAVGAGISAQMRGSAQVTLCFIGDGESNTGGFHEGINLAAVWDLAVVFIIENNVYAETTNIATTCKLPNLADRACAFGIPGKTVDGNDVLAVYEALIEAVTRARDGKGPTIVEGKTYRWHGHFEGDTMTYRTRQELEDWKKKEPISRYRQKLIETGILSEEDADKITQEIGDEIDEAVKFAESSPLPAVEEVLEDVYA